MNIIITAPKGKIDSLILEEATKINDIDVVGCLGPRGVKII